MFMMMMMMMSGSFECARRYTLNADCQNELSDYYNWSLILSLHLSQFTSLDKTQCRKTISDSRRSSRIISGVSVHRILQWKGYTGGYKSLVWM